MAKAQLDAQTKLEIARMNNETELIKVQAQISANGAMPELQAQLAELRQQQEELSELALYLHSAVAQPAEAMEPDTNPVEPAQAPAEVPPAIPAGAQPVTAGPTAGME